MTNFCFLRFHPRAIFVEINHKEVKSAFKNIRTNYDTFFRKIPALSDAKPKPSKNELKSNQSRTRKKAKRNAKNAK